MRTAIVQYFINPYKYSEPRYHNILSLQPLVDLSKRSFEVYCKKYKIDFIRVQKSKLGYRHPAFERFDLWLDKSWWKKYDQICYVDCDVIALPHAPNIFESYPEDTFKYCYYEKYRNSKLKDLRSKHKKTLLGIFKPQTLRDRIFQIGVFVLTKNTAKQMYDWIKVYKKLAHTDTEILNWADTDFYKQTRTYPKYTIQQDDKYWKPTPPDYMEGIEPHWNKIRKQSLEYRV